MSSLLRSSLTGLHAPVGGAQETNGFLQRCRAFLALRHLLEHQMLCGTGKQTGGTAKLADPALRPGCGNGRSTMFEGSSES